MPVVPRPRTAVVALLTAGLVGGSLAGGAPAGAAAATGTVSGTVADDTGAPVAGLVVSARTPADAVLATATTDSAGRYRLTAPVGDRAVCFDGTGLTTASGGYVFRCVGGTTAAAATPVRVVAGRVRSGVDGTVPRAAVVTGRVTGADGSALAGVAVRDTTTGAVLATTDARGRYRTPGLDSGAHPQVVPCFTAAAATGGSAPQGYADTCLAAVTLAPGVVVTADAALQQASAITGRVTGADGAVLPGVVVAASGTSITAVTGSDGRYRLRRVPPDLYNRITFTPPATLLTSLGTGYLPGCYGDVGPDCLFPRPVQTVAGQTVTGVGVTLRLGAGVTGLVADVRGKPVPDIGVVFYRNGGNSPFDIREVGTTTTGADGRYRATAVEPDAFACIESDAATPRPSWPDQGGYNAGTSCANTPLTAGAFTELDITVESLGQITGRVVDATTGVAVTGATVTVTYPEPGPHTPFVQTVSVTTDGLGRYRIPQLAVATWSLCVSGVDDRGYAPTCGPAGADLRPAGALPVVVRDGATTDAGTTRLGRFASVAGRVTDPAGFPLAEVAVTVTLDAAAGWTLTTTTGTDGRYTVAVPPRRLTVCMDGSAAQRNGGPRPAGGWGTRCWDDRPTGSPTPITPGSGAQRTGVDVVLTPTPTT